MADNLFAEADLDLYDEIIDDQEDTKSVPSPVEVQKQPESEIPSPPKGLDLYDEIISSDDEPDLIVPEGVDTEDPEIQRQIEEQAAILEQREEELKKPVESWSDTWDLATEEMEAKLNFHWIKRADELVSYLGFDPIDPVITEEQFNAMTVTADYPDGIPIRYVPGMTLNQVELAKKLFIQKEHSLQLRSPGTGQKILGGLLPTLFGEVATPEGLVATASGFGVAKWLGKAGGILTEGGGKALSLLKEVVRDAVAGFTYTISGAVKKEDEIEALISANLLPEEYQDLSVEEVLKIEEEAGFFDEAPSKMTWDEVGQELLFGTTFFLMFKGVGKAGGKLTESGKKAFETWKARRVVDKMMLDDLMDLVSRVDEETGARNFELSKLRAEMERRGVDMSDAELQTMLDEIILFEESYVTRNTKALGEPPVEGADTLINEIEATANRYVDEQGLRPSIVENEEALSIAGIIPEQTIDGNPAVFSRPEQKLAWAALSGDKKAMLAVERLIINNDPRWNSLPKLTQAKTLLRHITYERLLKNALDNNLEGSKIIKFEYPLVGGGRISRDHLLVKEVPPPEIFYNIIEIGVDKIMLDLDNVSAAFLAAGAGKGRAVKTLAVEWLAYHLDMEPAAIKKLIIPYRRQIATKIEGKLTREGEGLDGVDWKLSRGLIVTEDGIRVVPKGFQADGSRVEFTNDEVVRIFDEEFELLPEKLPPERRGASVQQPFITTPDTFNPLAGFLNDRFGSELEVDSRLISVEPPYSRKRMAEESPYSREKGFEDYKESLGEKESFSRIDDLADELTREIEVKCGYGF